MTSRTPIQSRDIYWLAGILEGEGCFVGRPGRASPVIQLMMTDKDVVVRAAEIMGANKVIQVKNHGSRPRKAMYRVNVGGRRAVSWLMTLLPLMGERRATKIRELIERWKHSARWSVPNRKTFDRPGTVVVWARQVACSLPQE